jgi:ABC-2 type transport system permease protein
MKSRRFKVLLAVMIFPAIIYLFSPNPNGEGIDAMRKAFQGLTVDLLPNYWLGIIGQLIIIILMSDLLASEIDKGTVRLLIARPVRISELVAGKLLAGLGVLAVMFAASYVIIWLYNPVVYGVGLDGLWESLGDFLPAIGVSILVASLLGALSMLISVVISRPLYASLTTFGVIFLLQFILPQIPYVHNPRQYTLGYQTVVLLKGSFDKVNLSAFSGDPSTTFISFVTMILVLLLLTWGAMMRREFPD